MTMTLLQWGEMRVIVVPDRTNGEAAKTIAEGADDAEQPLPEAEEIARADHVGLCVIRRIDVAIEKAKDLAEAEFLRRGGAGSLLDVEVADRIRWTTMEAARAGFADADLLGHRSVRLEREFRQNAGEINPRAKLRRQNVYLQAERA